MNRLLQGHGRFFKISGWDFYSFFIFVVVLIFQLSNWPKLPLFLDCYYHLSVTSGFNDAGGWVGRAFWEYAPYGRPHLYPPLFHLLELTVFKAGLNLITVARLFDFLIYPSFLFICWCILRDLYSKELAFFNLLLTVSSYSLFLAIVNNIPFSLAFIFGFLSFYFFKKSRFLSSFLMLALSFYSHTLMSWLMFFALGLYGLWSPKERKALLWILFWAVLAASPLFYHQLKFINFYRPMRVLESYYVQINIFLYILALMGFVLALKRRGDYLFFVAVLLSMSTLIFTHRDRFFSGQGLVPLSFLAAFLLEDLRKRCFLKKDNRLNMAFWILLIAVFYCLTPLITFSPLRRSPKFVVTSRIMDKEQKEAGFHEDKGETFYFPNLVNETVQALRQNSREDDIVFSNYNYGGGIMAVLAHRAMSNAMLREVLPFKEIDIIDAARLILWFKTPGGGFPQDLREITRLYRLKKIGETQLVYLYLNEDSHFRRRVVRASVPYGVCGSILLLVLLAVSLDCFRPGRGQT